jgi:S1-C subfamily serine protease
VIVTDVELNSPAHEAGFKVGDVITQFSGKPIQGTRDIWSAMDNIDARAGDDLDVVIIRQGRFLKLRLKLGRVRS